MAPKSPWKHNTPKNNWRNDPTLASPRRASNVASPAYDAGAAFVAATSPSTTAIISDDLGPINYSEIQADEIDALQSIYFDSYEEVEVKSAWNKTTDRAFRLKLASSTDKDTSITLSVKFTATYPKTLPLLQVAGLEHLHVTARANIQRIIKTRPQELRRLHPGEAMIYHIADEISNILEDAVLSREQGVLPSLEDERIIQESTAEQNAREAVADEARRIEAAQAKEAREMNEKVQQELEKRDKQRSSMLRSSEVQSPENDHTASKDDIYFDRTIRLGPRTDSTAFDTVTLISTVSTRGDGGVFTAKPKSQGRLSTDTDLLAVRKVRLTMPSGDNINWEALYDLEKELERLQSLRSSSSVNIYAFKIEPANEGDNIMSQDRIVSVLTDYANRGSLAEMLEDNQTIPLQRARQWSVDLLEALDYYHRQGIVHKRIHPGNVLFSRSSLGVMQPKLADADYEDRLLRLEGRPSVSEKGKKMAAWLAPELTEDINTHSSRTDIWDFGVLLIQMLFGTEITSKHANPHVLVNSLSLSEPLKDLLHQIFSKDGKDRPAAFDLLPSEFFRSDIALMSTEHSTTSSRQRRPSSSYGFSSLKSPGMRRSRQNSLSAADLPSSRYLADFTELGRLGRGGFGEVVRSRNRIDGGIYAIKKVKQESEEELRRVLSEARFLSKLNHNFVVRYYTAWLEEDFSNNPPLDNDSTTESYTTSNGPHIEFGLSSRGLDFGSSQDFNIEFGDDSSDENDGNSNEAAGDDDDDDDDNGYDEAGADDYDESTSGTQTDARHRDNAALSGGAIEDSESPLEKIRSDSRRSTRSTLYIQMEYCEGLTLRQLIKQGNMYSDPQEGWKMLRQILEGLSYIHRHGIIHRDLKPDNVFIDEMGSPRIGDFGLATTSRHLPTNKGLARTNTGENMTRSIGTALYVAPEVKSGAGNYNDKVDMYALGIIFFEMCYPLHTGMERSDVLSKLREPEHALPPAFQEPEKVLQGNVIMSLVSHDPNERPGSTELLRSGMLPAQVEEETIREAMQGMLDAGSPYHHRMMAALFAQSPEQHIKSLAWDTQMEKKLLSTNQLRVHDVARTLIRHVLRRHGAEETEGPTLFACSPHYTVSDVFRLIDVSGNLLQLPYDLTLPYAKQLAKEPPNTPTERTFVFGNVFRGNESGGPPKTRGVVDFNVVSSNGSDLALHEAECMKVVEETIEAFPALKSRKMCFHFNHSDILELLLDHCRIDKAQRPAVKDILSKLNLGAVTWQNVRADLRAPSLAIHITSVDELAKFNFRETPEKIYGRLQTMLEGSIHASRIRRPLEQLEETIVQMKLMGVERKVYVSPLSCYNENFYTGGILFQCVFDQKEKRAFAVGGRYDSLIEAHRMHPQSPIGQCHAVGVSIGWELIIKTLLQDRKSMARMTQPTKVSEGALSAVVDRTRCDILVASVDDSVLHTAGVKLLSSLWGAELSAELANDTKVVDSILSRQVETSHSWIIVVKQDGASTYKVWNTLSNSEMDVASTNIISYLRGEVKERENGASIKTGRHPPLSRQASHHAGEIEREREKPKANVQVLLAQHKSKKGNKYHIVSAANENWHTLLDGLHSAPILALETRDEVLESMRDTRLSDSDSWKKFAQRLPVNERQYLGQAQDWLGEKRRAWMESNGERLVGVYNFRSSACICYDVGA